MTVRTAASIVLMFLTVACAAGPREGVSHETCPLRSTVTVRGSMSNAAQTLVAIAGTYGFIAKLLGREDVVRRAERTEATFTSIRDLARDGRPVDMRSFEQALLELQRMDRDLYGGSVPPPSTVTVHR
ncbi:MAG: hypothetical protein ABIK13_04800 [Patescibacteria group bacterium]